MDPLKTMKENGCTIKIYQDENCESPRETCSNLGTMLYTSYRYTLGDKRVEAREIAEIIKGDSIWLPTFAYIHSGIVMNTVGFSCPWDSGQCGIIYATQERIEEEYGNSQIELVKSVFVSEVEEFSKFLEGDVYGYVITNEAGDEMESCWGVYGLEYCEKEAIQTAKLEPATA